MNDKHPHTEKFKELPASINLPLGDPSTIHQNSMWTFKISNMQENDQINLLRNICTRMGSLSKDSDELKKQITVLTYDMHLKLGIPTDEIFFDEFNRKIENLCGFLMDTILTNREIPYGLYRAVCECKCAWRFVQGPADVHTPMFCAAKNLMDAANPYSAWGAYAIEWDKLNFPDHVEFWNERLEESDNESV